MTHTPEIIPFVYAQEARLSSTQRLLDLILPDGVIYRCDLAALSNIVSCGRR